MDKTVNRLSIHMSNEVSSFESCFMCRPTIFYVPDHVIDGVDVTVTSVHPDCPQRETKLLPTTVDDNGLPWVGGTEGGVSARRGVS